MSKCKHLSLLFTLLLFSALSYNAYAGPCLVPNFIGSTETQAINELDGIDCLNYGGSTRENNPAPADEVIGQDPSSGTEIASPPGTVTLTVSDGPATTTTSTTTTTTTTTTTAATTSTTAPSTTTTAATTSTTAPSTTTTAATTSTTAPTTTSTAATTSTTGATTTTTMGGGGTTTTTTAASTTTTTPTTSTTTAATTTTTTLPPDQSDDDLFDFGGGGCSIGKTSSASMDPIWLLMLLVPGLGILRRRQATTGARGTKRA